VNIPAYLGGERVGDFLLEDGVLHGQITVVDVDVEVTEQTVMLLGLKMVTPDLDVSEDQAEEIRRQILDDAAIAEEHGEDEDT
jgi:hypothetical protein